MCGTPGGLAPRSSAGRPATALSKLRCAPPPLQQIDQVLAKLGRLVPSHFSLPSGSKSLGYSTRSPLHGQQWHLRVGNSPVLEMVNCPT